MPLGGAMSLRRHRARGLLLVVPLVAVLVLGGAVPAPAAAPANDNVSSAQALSGVKGVAYGTLVGATIESGTCGSGQAYETRPRCSVHGRW